MQSSGMIDIELERPKTSKGRRKRPTSRLGRRPSRDLSDEVEGDEGRPASRRGFTPETYERHDYDEFSRQVPDTPSPEFISGSPPPYSVPYPPGTQYPVTDFINHNYSQSTRNEGIYRERPISREKSDNLSSSSPGLHGEYSKSDNLSPSSPNRHGEYLKSDNLSPSSPGLHGEYLTHDRQRRFIHYERRQSQDHEEGLPPTGYRHSKYSPEGRHSNRSPARSDTLHKRDSLTVPFDRPSSGYPIYDRQMSPSENQDYQEYQLQRQTSPKTQNYNYQEYQSSEMAPQVSPRPKSSRKRPRSARRTAAKNPQVQIEGQPTDDPINTPVLRPQSSLSRYKPLPAIGTMIDPSTTDQFIEQSLSPQTQVLKLDDDENSNGQIFNFDTDNIQEQEMIVSHHASYKFESYSPEGITRQNYESISKKHLSGHPHQETNELGVYEPEIPFKPHILPEEPTAEEHRILLAVRLLNGQRHERHFRPTEQLDLVLQFAENKGNQDLSGYNLACNAPRLVFSDMTLFIGETGLAERTVLYLESRECD